MASQRVACSRLTCTGEPGRHLDGAPRARNRLLARTHTHTHHLQRGQRANVESVHARIQPEKGVRTHPTPAQTDTLSRLMRHLRESEVGEGWPEISDSSS